MNINSKENVMEAGGLLWTIIMLALIAWYFYSLGKNSG